MRFSFDLFFAWFHFFEQCIYTVHIIILVTELTAVKHLYDLSVYQYPVLYPFIVFIASNWNTNWYCKTTLVIVVYHLKYLCVSGGNSFKMSCCYNTLSWYVSAVRMFTKCSLAHFQQRWFPHSSSKQLPNFKAIQPEAKNLFKSRPSFSLYPWDGTLLLEGWLRSSTITLQRNV